MSSWIQYKSAPGPTESEAVPTGMTNEQVYKLQGKVGVLCVCVCVFSFRNMRLSSEKLHKAPRAIFKALQKEKNI